MGRDWVTVGLLLVVWGSGQQGSAGQRSGSRTRDNAVAADSSPGAVHEVRMLLTADGEYAYQPKDLAIRPGDRVRWVNESGGPHNVAFYADRIPAGARDALNGAMGERMGDANLTGRLMSDANDVYEIVFTGVPTGRYEYFCTPHELLGMKAALTIAP